MYPGTAGFVTYCVQSFPASTAKIMVAKPLQEGSIASQLLSLSEWTPPLGFISPQKQLQCSNRLATTILHLAQKVKLLFNLISGD